MLPGEWVMLYVKFMEVIFHGNSIFRNLVRG